jgi:Tol biopolymer transport system component
VIATCLAKDPDRRFQTAVDLKRNLAWAMEQPSGAAAPNTARFWWVAVAAALLLGVLGTRSVIRFRQPAIEEQVFHFQIAPPEGGRFTATTTYLGGLAISPDGKTAAYVATVGGTTGLWVRPIDAPAAHLIPGTDAAAFPFWSPDSKSVGFYTRNKLERVDVSGGSPSVICEENSRGGAWGSDGSILFGTLSSGLFRVTASGGKPTPLTALDVSLGESSHRWPQLLPGGRFLYWAQDRTHPERSAIYAATLARPAERVKLLSTDSSAIYGSGPDGKGYLLWLRSGTLVAQEFQPETLKLGGEPHAIAEPMRSNYPLGLTKAAVSMGGVLLFGNLLDTLGQLTWFDRNGKTLSTAGEPVEYIGQFRLSPDGQRVAAGHTRGGISMLEIKRGVSSPLTFPTGAPRDVFPAWSPDGRTILFNRFGTQGLFRKDTNGVGAEQLVVPRPNIPYPTDWSNNGQWVLIFDFTPERGSDLWILPMTPDGQPRPGAVAKPYLQTRFNEQYGRFSPEPSPRWIAFMSDETGRDEIYIDAFPEPRGKKRISTAGGRFPQWGAQGLELFYVSPDEKLMAVSLKVSTDSVEPSTPRELFRLPSMAPGTPQYEATRDGQRFLVLAGGDQNSQPLEVIVNWPALMKKGAPAP